VLDDSTWLQPFVGQYRRDLLQVQVAQSIESERVSPKQQALHPCPQSQAMRKIHPYQSLLPMMETAEPLTYAISPN
jgi:hypothetical protein